MRSAREEDLSFCDAALATRMFEEPEWAEAAPAVMGLSPVTSQPAPAAAAQIKVSGHRGDGRCFRPLIRLWESPALGSSSRVYWSEGHLPFRRGPSPNHQIRQLPKENNVGAEIVGEKLVRRKLLFGKSAKALA